MCSKCEKPIDCGCTKSVAITTETVYAGCRTLGSDSQLSAPCFLSNGSTLAVYKRRKLDCRPVSAPSAQACENTSIRTSNIVYRRRKLQKNLVYRRRKLEAHPFNSFVDRLSQKMGPNVKSMGVCASVIKLENPPTEKNSIVVALRRSDVKPSTSVSATINEPALTNSAARVDCLVQVHVSNEKHKPNKTVEMCSMGDSCSSSMLNVDIDSSSLGIELDDSGECSSSGDLMETMQDDLSGKDLCISILRSHGLLSGSRQASPPNSAEDSPYTTSVSSTRTCDVCSHTETAGNMLICDHCEAAFHLSCCSSFVEKVLVDEWYCQSCSKKKRILMKEKEEKRSPIMKSAKSSVSDGKQGSIAFMLSDTRPYTTGVRIGKDFQAAVPEWSGPTTEDTDAVSEPLELDLSGTLSLPETKSSNPTKSSAIGNWLQCRQIVDGTGDGSDGTVCGKWRRAPLFEVQTDDWECFRSVLWDPTHADCAVPQELQTDQVLKQLKYIEMLKPRLNQKKRKLTAGELNGCRGTAEDKLKGSAGAVNCCRGMVEGKTKCRVSKGSKDE
ncbi:PHD and RING finger domain-containing protein [Drosera capensis]